MSTKATAFYCALLTSFILSTACTKVSAPQSQTSAALNSSSDVAGSAQVLPKKMNLQFGPNDDLTCMKPFIAINDNNMQTLQQELLAHPACIETARYKKFNYLTFALELRNKSALQILLQVPKADGQSGIVRVFDEDDSYNSVFNVVLNSSDSSLKDYPEFLYNLGLTTQEQPNFKRTIADIFWTKQDAKHLLEVYKKYGLRIHGSEDMPYEEFLALDGNQPEFLKLYLAEYNPDLSKTYQLWSKKLTLLEIALENGSRRNYQSAAVIIDAGAPLTQPKFNELVYLLDSDRNDKLSSPEIDDVLISLAHRFPTFWNHLADQGSSEIQQIAVSLLTRDVATFKNLSDSGVFGSKTKPAVLLYRLPKFPRDFKLPLEAIEPKIKILAENNIYFEPSFLQDISPTYLHDLIPLVKQGLQAMPWMTRPDCTIFENAESFSSSDVDDLLKLGVPPKKCGEAAGYQVRNSSKIPAATLMYLALKGDFSPAFSDWTMKSGDKNLVDTYWNKFPQQSAKEITYLSFYSIENSEVFKILQQHTDEVWQQIPDDVCSIVATDLLHLVATGKYESWKNERYPWIQATIQKYKLHNYKTQGCDFVMLLSAGPREWYQGNFQPTSIDQDVKYFENHWRRRVCTLTWYPITTLQDETYTFVLEGKFNSKTQMDELTSATYEVKNKAGKITSSGNFDSCGPSPHLNYGKFQIGQGFACNAAALNFPNSDNPSELEVRTFNSFRNIGIFGTEHTRIDTACVNELD